MAIRETLQTMKEKVQASPGKWAGIAAGAGFGLGLIGRVMSARRKREMPAFVLIDTHC